LLPALAASKAGLEQDLKGSERSHSAGPATQRARNGLVISEIALALVLMIGAGLMIESFRRVSAVDPGFDPRGVIAMRVALSSTRYDALDRQNAFYKQVLDRLRAIPGLKSVGAVDGLPFTDGGFDNSFSIEGRPEQPPGQPLKADIRRIDAGYFAAMRIGLVEGRGFKETDRRGAPPVAIISQSMARKYWPNERAAGKRLSIHFGPPEGIRAEIIGVAADVRPALDSKPNDYIYMHYPQGYHVGQMDLVLRPDERSQITNAGALGRAVRAAVASIDADQPVYRIRTMSELLSISLATRRFQMMLLGIFAACAACLAAVGLFGVLAYSVQARTKEIGIRTALGATRDQVSAMVLKDALKLTATGVVAGAIGALGLTRFLSNLLYGIEATDSSVFIAVSLLLVAVAVSAAYFPARRAARIDPTIALRHE
jgi:putative ABC transport system permease protein